MKKGSFLGIVVESLGELLLMIVAVSVGLSINNSSFNNKEIILVLLLIVASLLLRYSGRGEV